LAEKYKTQNSGQRYLAFFLSCILCILYLLILPDAVFGIQRFPPPEFTSGHELPTTTQPPPRSDFYEYMDVGVLILALSLGSYLALKRRSRRGIFALGIFSLLYFGFWRKGCVCAIGAVQNVSLGLFQHSYAIPVAVIAFFSLPLIFTLFFGRTFCAGVCPLGAIQDVVLIRPVKVPSWLENALGMLVYVYFGAAILFAVTGSAFIICEYDPFVSFFRRTGSFNILFLGAGILVIAMFIGRPYCRYLCPYSVLLRLTSRSSKWHVTITPDKCIKCGLCEDACPFGSIQKPNQTQTGGNRSEGKTRLAALIILLPILLALGIWFGVSISDSLSRIHPRVSLAERVWMEDAGAVEGSTEASDAFRKTGQPTQELYQEASAINRQFTIGSGILGAFLGLAIGMKMVQVSVRRSREDYEINQATCVSCGRCIDYCPVGKKTLNE
jgi:ferredoxin